MQTLLGFPAFGTMQPANACVRDTIMCHKQPGEVTLRPPLVVQETLENTRLISMGHVVPPIKVPIAINGKFCLKTKGTMKPPQY